MTGRRIRLDALTRDDIIYDINRFAERQGFPYWEHLHAQPDDPVVVLDWYRSMEYIMYEHAWEWTSLLQTLHLPTRQDATIRFPQFGGFDVQAQVVEMIHRIRDDDSFIHVFLFLDSEDIWGMGRGATPELAQEDLMRVLNELIPDGGVLSITLNDGINVDGPEPGILG